MFASYKRKSHKINVITDSRRAEANFVVERLLFRGHTKTLKIYIERVLKFIGFGRIP